MGEVAKGQTLVYHMVIATICNVVQTIYLTDIVIIFISLFLYIVYVNSFNK